MEIIKSVILGAVQGLTEFLPISSSGHLILMRDILGLGQENGLAFDAVLQLATTLAIVVYFRREVFVLAETLIKLVFKKNVGSEDKKMFWFVTYATIPAILLGLLLENTMETLFRSSILVAVMLIVGSAVMFFAERHAKHHAELSNIKSLYIGLFQSLALIPGMSRSGMTISGGLYLGLKREVAVRMSFVMAVPILIGSGLKKFLDLLSGGGFSAISLELFFGSLTAFIVGMLAIHFLIKFLRHNSMRFFVWYRVFLAIVILAVLI